MGLIYIQALEWIRSYCWRIWMRFFCKCANKDKRVYLMSNISWNKIHQAIDVDRTNRKGFNGKKSGKNSIIQE